MKKDREWISVKDRLPENPDDVLVFVVRYVQEKPGARRAPCDQWVQIAWLGCDGIWADDESAMITFGKRVPRDFTRPEVRFVTHWQPLPEPPK